MIKLIIAGIIFSGAISYFMGIRIIDFFIMLLGIEGAVLLAFSFLPQPDQLNIGEPKNLLKKFKWWFEEGSKKSVPFQFNPINFYLGLIFIAFSLALSAIKR